MMLGASCRRLGLQGTRCATTSPGPDGHTHRVCLGAAPNLGAPSMGADAVDLGPSALLIDADGNLITDTRTRLDLALRYISNWYRATDGSDNQSIWWVKIDGVRAKVEAAFTAMDPAKVFPGKDELAVYSDAQLAFADLYRQLQFSSDTLPKPGLLDLAADFVDALAETPGIILTTVVDKVSKGIGDATKKAITNLWPILAVVAVAGGGYLAVKAKVFK
jgi:hypothetical protein